MKIDVGQLSQHRLAIKDETFPGVIYRMGNPVKAVLIFSSGKIVFTGARTKEDIDMAYANLKIDLAVYKSKKEWPVLVHCAIFFILRLTIDLTFLPWTLSTRATTSNPTPERCHSFGFFAVSTLNIPYLNCASNNRPDKCSCIFQAEFFLSGDRVVLRSATKPMVRRPFRKSWETLSLGFLHLKTFRMKLYMKF